MKENVYFYYFLDNFLSHTWLKVINGALSDIQIPSIAQKYQKSTLLCKFQHLISLKIKLN